MRLSELPLRKIYDSGVRHISHLHTPRVPVALPNYPIKEWALLPDGKKRIRALAPQALYLTLKAEGLADCLEVLPLLSRAQFTRLCDYDVWPGDQLSLRHLCTWLQHCEMALHGENFRRFRELEEEYQIAALSPCIRIFDQEEYEKLSDDEQDQVHALPGNAFYYAIETDDSEIFEAVQSLIACGLEQDIPYLISLLSHAAYMPPHESELTLSQFRRARMEEDGFVTEEESWTLFQTLSLETYTTKWKVADTAIPHALTVKSTRWLLEDVLEVGKTTWTPEVYDGVVRNFLYLSNALLVACQLPLEDRKSLEQVFAHVQGLVNMGLESLAAGQPELGARILSEESPKTLFRIGFTLLRNVQGEVLRWLENLPEDKRLPSQVVTYWKQQKYGLVLEAFDLHQSQLGYHLTEVLKGLFNRFPMKPEPAQADGKIYFTPVTSLREIPSIITSIQTLLGQGDLQ